MAIVTIMKANLEISLKSFYEKVSKCVRRWTYDHVYPCNGAISLALEDIEAQGFIKRRIYADDSISLISDFENRAFTTDEPTKDDIASDEAMCLAHSDELTEEAPEADIAMRPAQPDTGAESKDDALGSLLAEGQELLTKATKTFTRLLSMPDLPLGLGTRIKGLLATVNHLGKQLGEKELNISQSGKDSNTADIPSKSVDDVFPTLMHGEQLAEISEKAESLITESALHSEHTE
jgi:hypothetical protein